MAVEEPAREPTKGQEADGVDSVGFDRVRRGFAPDQVAEYLKHMSMSVLTLESRLEETRNELGQVRRERDDARAELASSHRGPNEDPSERVTELMRTFDQLVGDLQCEAEAEADRILRDVRTDADRLLVQAREEAGRITADAREEAERTRASAQSDERESRVRAERILAQAKDEANRAESDIAAMRSSTLDTFRDIRRRTFMALGELESAIEKGATSERVVTVDEAEEVDFHGPVQIPRPDL